MSESDVRQDLAEEARKRVDEMPGESAAGNADPQAGGEGDPDDYRNVQNDPGPTS